MFTLILRRCSLLNRRYNMVMRVLLGLMVLGTRMRTLDLIGGRVNLMGRHINRSLDVRLLIIITLYCLKVKMCRCLNVIRWERIWLDTWGRRLVVRCLKCVR